MGGGFGWILFLVGFVLFCVVSCVLCWWDFGVGFG